jgi:hypothetical protein
LPPPTDDVHSDGDRMIEPATHAGAVIIGREKA